MSKRPTPETDALIISKGGFGMTNYEWREHSRRLERERDEAREAVRLASIEAKALATSIQKSEYSDVKFELCDSVAGVISQIDNMYAGVREQRDEAREVLREIAEASGFDNIGNWARNKALEALKTK